MYAEYMSLYMRDRRQKRRQKFIALLGGKCQQCGTTENLEFDHRLPRYKKHDFNHLIDGPEKLIAKELKKCVLLCKQCHFDKTTRNQEHINRDKKPARHGTVWKYKQFGCRCKRCRLAMRMYRLRRLRPSRQ